MSERREGDWDCPDCGALNFSRRETCFKCDAGGGGGGGGGRKEGRKDGDWDCPDCGVLNFASRDTCFKCSKGTGGKAKRSSKKPPAKRREGQNPVERREGDWDCQACGAQNFAYRDTCFKCGAGNDDAAGAEEEDYDNYEDVDAEDFPEEYAENEDDGGNSHRTGQQRKAPQEKKRREGDWDCPDCGAMNFAARDSCFKCSAGKPAPPKGKGGKEKRSSRAAASERREGDWDCLDCGAQNFAYRDSCFKCGAPQPQAAESAQPEAASARRGDHDAEASGAIRALSKISPQFKKSWVTYCRTMEQGSSDPSKCDAAFVLEFANYAADLLQVDLGVKEPTGAPPAAPPATVQKRPAEAAKAPAPAAKKKLTMKKSVADRIAALNAAGGLVSQLRLGAVAAALGALDEASALEVLQLLEEQQAEVEDPNAFVRIQADFTRSGASAKK